MCENAVLYGNGLTLNQTIKILDMSEVEASTKFISNRRWLSKVRERVKQKYCTDDKSQQIIHTAGHTNDVVPPRHCFRVVVTVRLLPGRSIKSSSI